MHSIPPVGATVLSHWGIQDINGLYALERPTVNVTPCGWVFHTHVPRSIGSGDIGGKRVGGCDERFKGTLVIMSEKETGLGKVLADGACVKCSVVQMGFY